MRGLLLALLCLAPSAARADATLTVLAAASLQAPLTSGAKAFEQAHPGVRVVVSGAATGVLVRQVEAGVPADVIVGAAEEPIEALHRQGLTATPRIVARNALVVAAPAASKASLPALDALRGSAFARIAIGRPRVVPAGDYAEEALRKAGLLDALRPRLVYGESVTQVLGYVRSGDVDAGFVYATDAKAAGKDVRVLLTLADGQHAPIAYPAAALTGSKQASLAAELVDFLASPQGQAALRQAGFLPP